MPAAPPELAATTVAVPDAGLPPHACAVKWRDLPTMGRIDVELTLANNGDLEIAETGLRAMDDVRRVALSGVVDTGTSHLVLPESAVDRLGLRRLRSMTVRFADGRTGVREVRGYVRLTLLNRTFVTEAVVEPGRRDALVGVLVLESLDLLVDPLRQAVFPRDPAGITGLME